MKLRFGRSYLRRLALYLYNHVVGRLPSHALRLFLYRRVFTVGDGATVMLGLTVRSLRDVSIGRNSNLNPRCMLDSRGGAIRIGDYVDIAPEVNVWTLEHDPADADFGTRGGGVTVGDYAWIANRAIILPGVTIGEGAVVAAGAVVVRDVPPWSIVGGVPAKVIGTRPDRQNPRRRYNPFLL